MAINRLGNHTGKKKHTTEVRLADFCINPFTFVGYRNNCFFERKNEMSFNASNREINRDTGTAFDKRQIQVENFPK